MSTQLMNQMFVLFGLIAVGYISNKAGFLDQTANTKLSAFLLNVALPATAIHSALIQEPMEYSVIFHGVGVAVAAFTILPILSILITRVFHWDKTYQLMLNYSNVGFMGLPIVSSVYGSESVFYAIMIMMVYNVHMFTMGIMILNGKAESPKVLLKNLCTPGIAASLLSFVIVILRIKVPAPAVNLLSSVGSITTPLAMMIIGSQLGMVNIMQVLKCRPLYLMTFFRLVVYPLVICVLFRLLLGNSLAANVATIQMGLPVGGNVTMLCSAYDGDTSLAAQGTCMSTFLSLVTVPVMLMLLG